MNRLLLFLLLCFSSFTYGQYLSVDKVYDALDKELDAKSLDYEAMADTIVKTCPLDKNGGFTYVQIVEAPGKTKEQLYVILNAWFLRSFGGNGILVNDKDLGCVMAQERFRKIAANGAITSSNTNYQVDIDPTIRVDIKDNKIRITYNTPCYELRDVTSAKWGRQPFKKNRSRSVSFAESYPYNPKGGEKKMMRKALVFVHYYSILVISDIERAIKEGVTGNEADDDW